MPQTVNDVMGPVKVRLAPGDTLRAVAVALAAARTGLGDRGGRRAEGSSPSATCCARSPTAPISTRRRPTTHMTADPVSVPPSMPLGEACDLMISRNVRHLLVSEGEALVGVLNMRDVVGILSGAAALGAVPPARGS